MQSRSDAPPQQKFGALNMVAALGTHIMSHPEVKNEMEQFILSFVTPALDSSEPYLRAIVRDILFGPAPLFLYPRQALEILGTVTKHGLQWSSSQQMMAHSQAAARALDDPEFPVRVQGALALTEMVLANEEVRAAVAPQVGKVVHGARSIPSLHVCLLLTRFGRPRQDVRRDRPFRHWRCYGDHR